MAKSRHTNIVKLLQEKRALEEKIKKNSREYIILFADLTKSTEYRITNPLLVSLDKIWTHNGTISNIIGDYGGEVIKWLGDGVMGAFDLSEGGALHNAVNASIEIQKKFGEYNKNILKPHKIESKIGLAMGECVFCNDDNNNLEDLLGTPVDTAARIQSLAQEKQILISEEMAKQLQVEKIGKTFLVYKEKILKGLGLKNIFEVVWKKEPIGERELPPISLTSRYEVIDIEKKVKKEVWVYTPHLLFEETYLELKKCISENLKNEVHYKYILPNESGVQIAFERLKNYWKSDGADVDTYLKMAPLKEPCILATIAVYDPQGPDTPRVIVSLPLSKDRKYEEIEEFHEVYLIAHLVEVNFYINHLSELLKFTCGIERRKAK